MTKSSLLARLKRYWGIFAIVFVVLISNTAYLFFTHAQPIYERSGLGKSLTFEEKNSIPFYEGDTYEANDGWISDALGNQAASQVVQGHLPLWNSYEGVGFSLLAETQSAAMFPFTWLQLLPEGWLIEHLLLQIIAGLGMYFFMKKFLPFIALRKKDLKRVGESIVSKCKHLELLSTAAGCLFATIGTFVITRNAAFNPVPFLGWMMLGVLLMFTSFITLSKKKQIQFPLQGLVVFITSFTLAIYAGFPETVYTSGLLVGLFFIALLIKTKMWQNVLWMLWGGGYIISNFKSLDC